MHQFTGCTTLRSITLSTCERFIRQQMAKRFFLSIAVFGAIVALNCPVWAERPSPSNNAAYMGVGSCSSSNCHGSVSPRNASHIPQNEYVTWDKHDLHSKAFVNLSNEDSKKIAQNLGINAAEKEPLCLKCHSTYLPPDAREGANFHADDGVGCESCHGAAENYLGPHTANDATHAHNLELGMMDVVSPIKRVELCATCHFGTNDKTVDHRLIGAGHPRLSFELDTFGMIQPRHWIVDEDYQNRKGDYNSARAWLIGQAYLAKRTIDRLQSDKLSKHGIFPELTIFYCFSCHHSLTEDQWKTREYNGRPGELLLNVSSIVMIRQALAILDGKLGETLDAHLSSLHTSYQNGDDDDVTAISSLLERVSKRVGDAPLNEDTIDKLLTRLSNYGSDTPSLQYEVAEQVAMGLSSLIATKSPDGSLHKKQMDALYQSLANSEAFEPEAFTEACKQLRQVL